MGKSGISLTVTDPSEDKKKTAYSVDNKDNAYTVTTYISDFRDYMPTDDKLDKYLPDFPNNPQQ